MKTTAGVRPAFGATEVVRRILQTIRLGILMALALAPQAAIGQNREPARVPVISNAFPLPRSANTWRLEARPAFDIGGGAPDGPYDLRYFQVRQLANGRLIVTNAATFDVRVYDSLGKHITTVGRRGEGPDEFRSFRLLPGGVTKAVIHDRTLSRMTWIDETGRLGPIASISQTAQRPGQGRELLGILTDGTAISVERTIWTFAGNSSTRDTSYYVAGPIGSGTPTVIAKAAGIEVLASPTRPGVMQPAVFGRRVVHAVGGDRLYLARNCSVPRFDEALGEA